MIVLVGGILGAICGAIIAKKRKGTTADILQYGFVYCIVFAIASLFIVIMIERFLA